MDIEIEGNPTLNYSKKRLGKNTKKKLKDLPVMGVVFSFPFLFSSAHVPSDRYSLFILVYVYISSSLNIF